MRFDDWPERLAALIDSRAGAPYAWGVNDCALFAADVVLEICGVDPMAAERGKYDTGLSARRLMRGGLEKHLIKRMASLEFPEVPPARALRGDVVLYRDHKRHPHVGIIGLNGQPIGPGADGLEVVPLSLCTRAWRI